MIPSSLSRPGTNAGRQTTQGGAELEAQNYIDIRQLIEGHSQILDNCTKPRVCLKGRVNRKVSVPFSRTHRI